ncbi:hypothetical protein [Microbulbifer sp.]|uniref:hypothetical protein n=1 Tax=Microbulbifer sp. TaxID=1908541 RepID=UPI0025866E95|nr:hypothetical protein [Microbulbifer sp.]
MLRNNDLTLQGFSDTYYGGREPTGTVKNWAAGKHVASSSSVMKVEREFPNSSKIFFLPIFDLLKTQINGKLIHKLFKVHIEKFPQRTWNFPELEFFHYTTKPPSIYRDNFSHLFEFGGVYGFIGILMLLREAEVQSDATKHFEILEYAYKAFPGFSRHPDFIDYWREFLDALLSIHVNLFTSAMLIQPKEDVIERQIFSEKHISNRYERPWSPATGRFEELEVPYEIARFHSQCQQPEQS